MSWILNFYTAIKGTFMRSIPAVMALILFSSVSWAAAPAADGATAHPAMSGAPSAASLPNQGKVVSIIDASIYTYIEVAQGDKIIWLAAPAVALKKDDNIRFSDGMEMKDFHSKTLDRTFPSIIFVNAAMLDK